MEISDELKDRILAEYSRLKPKLDECVAGRKFKLKFAIFPIYIDGVIDTVRYNVEEGRFDQIAITVATEGIVASDMLSDGTVWCDEHEEVIIPLEN